MNDDGSDVAALARCVGDVEGFARDHWGRRPLHRAGVGPFDDLLDLDAVDHLLVQTARRPTFRLVRSGETLAPDASTTTVRLGGTVVEDAADPRRIAAELADGATLVLQGLQRTWLPLARFCRRLERATSHAVQANAYLTPPGATGLGRHADTHHVLVLQLEGAKSWTIDGLGDIELQAGDVLYLPTGTGHAAAAQAATSLHLTIGLLADTYRHAIGRALDAAAGDLGLDRPLPLGFAGPGAAGALADGLAAAMKATAEHLIAADPGERAAIEADRARRRRRPLWTGQIRSALAGLQVEGTTRWRRRPDHPARLLPELAEDGRLVLDLVDRRLLVPAIARRAVERVLSAADFTVGDLPGLDEDGRVVLVRRLVREGLVEVVPG